MALSSLVTITMMPVSVIDTRASLAHPANLQVVDYQDAGEQYTVYENGVLLGATGKVTADRNTNAAIPQDAINDQRFSKRMSKQLAIGEHMITLKVDFPHNSGSGAVRLMNSMDKLWKDGDDNDIDNDGIDHIQ
jgi:hypothetical protein